MNKQCVLLLLSCFLAQVLAEELSVAQRYIAVLQKLSTGTSLEEDITQLFSPSITKITNSKVICAGRSNLLKQLYHFHTTDRIENVELLETIQSADCKQYVVRFEIAYEGGSVDTVIAILKCDSSEQIIEINQVYGEKASYSWELCNEDCNYWQRWFWQINPS